MRAVGGYPKASRSRWLRFWTGNGFVLSFVLFSFVLFSFVLFYFVLFCFIVFCFILFYLFSFYFIYFDLVLILFMREAQ